VSTTPKPVKALRNYYKDRFKERDTDVLLADLMDESDRAAVIIMASVLEDALALALSQRMGPFVGEDGKKDHEKLFEYDGPLGSFSAKIAMARGLNIIEHQTRKELDNIREMRNACAHSFQPISFKIPELEKVCMLLFGEHRLVTPPDIEKIDLKVWYLNYAMALFVVISEGSREKALAKMAQGA
jgi:hypothetical protein